MALGFLHTASLRVNIFYLGTSTESTKRGHLLVSDMPSSESHAQPVHKKKCISKLSVKKSLLTVCLYLQQCIYRVRQFLTKAVVRRCPVQPWSVICIRNMHYPKYVLPENTFVYSSVMKKTRSSLCGLTAYVYFQLSNLQF